MADSMPEIEIVESSKPPLPQLPIEIIDKIFEALLHTTEPVDLHRRSSAYIRVLALFNVNRKMRAEAPKKIVRHLRFSIQFIPRSWHRLLVNYPLFPLAALHHIEIRIPVVFSLRRYQGEVLAMGLWSRELTGFIKQTFGAEPTPHLRTIVYSLYCDILFSQHCSRDLSSHYSVFVNVIHQIQMFTPSNAVATIKLDTRVQGFTDHWILPHPGDEVTGLAREVLTSPEVEVQVKADLVS